MNLFRDWQVIVARLIVDEHEYAGLDAFKASYRRTIASGGDHPSNAEKDMRLSQDEKEEGLSLLFRMIIFPV